MPAFAKPHWDVFISHATEDTERARALVTALSSRGLRGWFDKDSLRFGEPFGASIQEGIRGSATFLVLLSTVAVEKDYVGFEVAQALTLRRPVIPVFLPGLEPGASKKEVFRQAAQYHGLKVGETFEPADMDRLARAIKRKALWARVPRGLKWAALLGIVAGVVLGGLALEKRFSRGVARDVALLVAGQPPPADPALPKPTLRWGLYGAPASAPTWIELADGATLRSGEDYFLRAAPMTAGWLYVWQTDSSGKQFWWFPRNETRPDSTGRNPVAAGEEVLLPPGNKGAYRLDAVTGDEHFFVVFCAARWPELEEALRKGGADLPQVLTARQVQVLEARSKGSVGVVTAQLDKPATTWAGKPVAWSDKEYRANANYVLGYRRVVHVPASEPKP
jgi:hypothetical protein